MARCIQIGACTLYHGDALNPHHFQTAGDRVAAAYDALSTQETDHVHS